MSGQHPAPSEVSRAIAPAARARRALAVGFAVVAAAGVLLTAAPVLAHGPSRQAARAFAEAVNLKASDVPRYGSEAGSQSRYEHVVMRRMALCIGARMNVIVRGGHARLDQSSATRYGHKGRMLLVARSNVTVLASSAEAAAQVRRLGSRKAQACMTRYLRRDLHVGRHPTSVQLVVRSSTVRAPGASPQFHWQVRARVKTTVRARLTHTSAGRPPRAAPRTLHITYAVAMILAGFAHGPAIVSVLTGAFRAPTETRPRPPVPTAAAQRLLTLLSRRADAHAL